ncbi:MAG: alpha-mannosidase [Clostridia bacterium]|nr:alpha-mannosidase [Clostridia bacterium]
MAKKKVYAVATSHLDTVWSWDLEETIREYVKATLTENFTLFENYPNYTFSFEGSYRYELMEEYYPELFERMKKYIDEGRWNVCGSAFENGDVNVPSPEALFRNILYGNSYFDEKFGKRSVDIFLPDCFGFGWALPSVMHHANLKGFTTQKLTWGSAYGTPFNIGRWRGVDGNEVFASVNPGSYSRPFKKIRDWDFILNKLKENEKFGLNWDYQFHGTGDRGGATKKESAELLEKAVALNDDELEIYPASADEIYHDLEKLSDSQKAKLPVWNNELVMQNHAVGGYTSRVMSKRWNRHSEELADMAERSAVIADYFGTLNYNTPALTRAWKRSIAHHFHDDMPGTSCQRVYKRSWNDLFVSMNQFKNEMNASLASLTSLMKTDFCKGRAVTVYNSVEAPRKTAVTARLLDIKSKHIRVFDENGNEVPAQVKSQKGNITEVVFIADVDALSLKVYDVRESNTPCKIETALKVTVNTLENEKYSVKLNENGDIESIFDKTINRELLKAPIVTGLFNYTGSSIWPAWEMNYEEANKKPDRIPQLASKGIIESGPARVAIKVTQKDDRSEFTNIISLTNDGQIVSVNSEIEWQSLRTMAKNIFTLSALNDKATFDLGLGAIERTNMSDKLFEVPAQKWADLSSHDGDFGVSVLSECKYGWDKYNINTLRLTVVHTPEKNYRIDSMQSMLDLGLNRYSYAIFSHKGKVSKETQKEAKFFTQPLVAIECAKHDGLLGTSYSFMNASSSAVIVRAIKKAEKSDEIIIRLNEGANSNIENYTLTLGNGIESAKEMFASEEYIKDATVIDGKLVTSFKPYEIKTFALKLKAPSVKGRNVTSTPVSLDFNKNIITKQGEKGEFEFTLPYEITPDSFTIAGAEFTINKNGNNTLTCEGQKISIPANSKKLTLVCASLKGDKTAEFKLDNEATEKYIPNAFERVARWDMYDFKETARIKNCEVTYESTHCHKNGEDVLAKLMYFFSVTFDVTNKSKLTLPADSDIIVISATATNGEIAEIKTPLLEEVPERKFTFKMTAKEKFRYINQRRKRNMGDKKCHNRKNWGKDY